MSGSLLSRRRRLLRRALVPLLILAALCCPVPGSRRWLTARGVRAATFVPNDFVVANNAFFPSAAVLRFDLSGKPDPAPAFPGTATFLPGTATGVAWGPDGNLYVINSSGGVDSFDVDTNTVTPYVSSAIAQFGHGLAFGPDGNLYVQPSGGHISRYCGPLNSSCAPGNPLPSGQLGSGSAFYAIGGGLNIVFGPDGNLYEPSGLSGAIVRYCGPINSACAPGAPDGISGIPTDPIFVTLGANVDAQTLAFGPDGNLYVSTVIAGVGMGDVRRFCGGPLNGSNCPTAMPDPAAGQTGAVFILLPAQTFNVLGFDFGPDGNLYLDLGEIDRYLGPNCTPAPCEGSPDPANGLSGATLVPPGTAGLGFSIPLKFPHVPSNPPPPPMPTLLVSDSGAGKVLRYDLAGNPFPAPGQSGADFVPANSAVLQGPTGVVIGPAGNLYVASNPLDSILRFDGVTGAPLPAQGQSGAVFVPSAFLSLNPPAGAAGLAFGPNGDLYVADSLISNVQRFNGTTGIPLPAQSPFDFILPNAGGLVMPQGIAFGPDQNLYVATDQIILSATPAGGVLRFDGNTGDFLGTFVQGKGGDTGFGIVFGPDGNLYVDNGEDFFDANGNHIVLNKVERFDGATGAPLPAPGQSGALFVPFVGPFPPAGLAFGPDGKLYVATYDPNNSFRGSIMRFDGQTGAFIDTIVSSGLDTPQFLTFSSPMLQSIAGGVFHDSVSAGNALPSAQVQVEVQQPGGLFTCPNAAFFFVPCPSTTTDMNGHYTLGGLQPGPLLVTAWPPANLNFFPNAILVNLPAGPTLTNQNIVLVPPAPIPANVAVMPSNPAAVTGGNVPVAFWNQPLTLSTTPGCSGANVTYTLALVPNPPSMPASMMEAPPGTYSAIIGPFFPFKGSINVTISVTCPVGSPQTSSFLLYIDPSGTVVDDVSAAPIPGATVRLFRSDTPKGTFTQVPAGSAFMSMSNRNNPDQTSAAGQYGWDVVPGFYYLQASAPGYTCDPSNPPRSFSCVNGAVQSGVFSIPPKVTDLTLPLHAISSVHATSLAYTGATQGDFDDPATLAATLTDTTAIPAAPIPGAALTLTLGSLSCVATTDATGRGACGVTPNQTAGPNPLTASFGGNGQFLASSASATFTVLTEETTLSITSSPTLALGSVITAQLQEDGTSPIANRTVTFTAGGLTATGATDGSGFATVALALAPGQYTLSASFAGDGNYRPSTAGAQRLFVFQPTQFVIWGGNPPIPAGQPANIHIGQECNFWGFNWAKQVLGGSFQAGQKFYGFAQQASGGFWAAQPSEPNGPPATVASYIGVIVATQATRPREGLTTGNIAEMVVVKVPHPGAYQPNPYHPGLGVVVAIVH